MRRRKMRMPEGGKRAEKRWEMGGQNTFFLEVWKIEFLSVWGI